MANRFEKGKSIFFLFRRGFTVQDSQLKPRYYLNLERARSYSVEGDEVIEYAPVRHGRWEVHQRDSFAKASSSEKLRCSLCGHFYYHSFGDGKLYCPNCGARMNLEG